MNTVNPSDIELKENPATLLKELGSWNLGTLDQEVLTTFFTRIPKVDLHRYLEGALTGRHVWEIAKEHRIKLGHEELADIRAQIEFTQEDLNHLESEGLKRFIQKFEYLGELFVREEVMRDVTWKVAQQAVLEGLTYVEFRFSPYYISFAHGLDLEKITRQVVEAVEEVQRYLPLEVSLILIAERQMGPEAAKKVLELAKLFQDRSIVAFDLANNEYDFPPGPYAQVFQEAKQCGFFTTAHAGEVPRHHKLEGAGGSHNVKSSVLELGVDRIGHGVRSYESQEVMDLLRERQIAVEMCPTSNVQTQACKDMSSHPIKDYLHQGLKVTLNNDDPGISAITLADDYQRVTQVHQLTVTEVFQILINAADVAFTSKEHRQRLRQRLLFGFAHELGYLAKEHR